MLPGPLEDGMMVRVGGTAKMHPQFGFSITAQSIQPTGVGSIAQAFVLLKAKLEKEGLFALDRKRSLPSTPHDIALVTSAESAAYADFIKITQARWPFAKITVYDTLVQGENAPDAIVRAIQQANSSPELPDVVVVTRGGGSADDLAAFNDERVVRSLAASRVPTLVAIGHEVDESLAELVADRRASTPSNAAELLLPDKRHELEVVRAMKRNIAHLAASFTALEQSALRMQQQRLIRAVQSITQTQRMLLVQQRQLLQSYNPANVLTRGYAIVRSGEKIIKNTGDARRAGDLTVQFNDGSVHVTIDE